MFASLKEIVGFAKSGAKLAAVAAAVLQNNKQEGLNLLKEETIKAAMAASLWNSPLKILTVIDTIKSGKKTTLAKQWLSATTTLSQALPTNKSGDVSRITDEAAFVSATNAAIAVWHDSWTAFDSAQKLKTEQRTSKATKTTPATATDTAAATPTPAATPAEPALFENSGEAASMRDTIAELQEKLASAEQRFASASRIIREREKSLETANERIAELETQLSEAQESKNFMQAQLISAIAEIDMLRAAATAPRKARTKKEETTA